MGAAVAAVTELLSPPLPVVRERVCACVRASVCLRAAPGLYYIHQGVGGGGAGEGLGEVAEEGEQKGGERVPEEAAAEEGQVISPTERACLWVARGGRRKGHAEKGPPRARGGEMPRRAGGAGTLPLRCGLGTIPDPRMDWREQSPGGRRGLADGGRGGGKSLAITS